MAKDAGLDLYSLRFEDASESRKKWCVVVVVLQLGASLQG